MIVLLRTSKSKIHFLTMDSNINIYYIIVNNNNRNCIIYYRFATPEIMYKYGRVLQNYKGNSELLNDAVLTMMHHIIGEMKNTKVLFQPVIFQTFLSLYTKKECLYKVRIIYYFTFVMLMSRARDLIIKLLFFVLNGTVNFT